MNIHFDAHMMEDVLMVLLPALTSAIPSGLLSIASYVLTSMALYTLADRRGIQKAWLSWVPVLNMWIIGSLSDQYRYVVKGQYKSKRKILLLLNLLSLLIGITMAVIGVVLAVEMASKFMYGVWNMLLAGKMMGPVLCMAGLALILAGLAIAITVIRYMALYDIYKSMDPSNSILFLVLSILVQVTEPFFLFFSRNKDAGMPPRKPEAHQPPRESVVETWQDEEICL